MKFPNFSKLFDKEPFDHELALSLMLAPHQRALPPSTPLSEAEIFDAEWSPSLIGKLEGYYLDKKD